MKNGTITSSPFKIPVGTPKSKFNRTSQTTLPQSPCSPVLSKIDQLDRMRMPPPPSPSATPNTNNVPSNFRSPSPKERFSLSSPLLRRPPTTPKYSPVVASIFTESPTFGNEWVISDYYFNSEDSSENEDKEEDRKYKYWCRRENLVKILEKQALIDADEVFGPPVNVCDLEHIFQRSRSNYSRTNRLSGSWSPDTTLNSPL